MYNMAWRGSLEERMEWLEDTSTEQRNALEDHIRITNNMVEKINKHFQVYAEHVRRDNLNRGAMGNDIGVIEAVLARHEPSIINLNSKVQRANDIAHKRIAAKDSKRWLSDTMRKAVGREYPPGIPTPFDYLQKRRKKSKRSSTKRRRKKSKRSSTKKKTTY